jgi:hypothetical protein
LPLSLALANDVKLHLAVAAFDDVFPAQGHEFRDPEAGGIDGDLDAFVDTLVRR